MSDHRATPIAALIIPAIMQGMLLLLGSLLLAGIAVGERPAPTAPAPPPTAPDSAIDAAAPGAPPPPAESLTPRMRAALGYTSRRYRVSAEALVPIFTAVQIAARELRLDPLLIVAVIGIESSFNPFSESVAGAQGLMQVVPRYHQDKLPEDGGKLHLFDPVTNIRVGTRALHDYIRRNGDIIGGLQQFAGDAGDPERGYAARVLAEKDRLENAGGQRSPAGLPEIR